MIRKHFANFTDDQNLGSFVVSFSRGSLTCALHVSKQIEDTNFMDQKFVHICYSINIDLHFPALPICDSTITNQQYWSILILLSLCAKMAQATRHLPAVFGDIRQVVMIINCD